MPRSVNHVASKARRKKILKLTRGYFGARHLSVSSKHLAKQVQLGKALIENDSLREQMSEAQRRERKPEAAMQIVSLLERLVSHE